VLGKAGEQRIDLSAEDPFRLGGASIDPAAHEAKINGSSERIQPQNLKVLIALARKRGQLVTRDELIGRCWDGRIIGDDVINRAISTLRQFAERAGGFGIETVPRAGYRLVDKSARPKWTLWILGAAIALVLAAGTTAFFMKSARHNGPSSPTIAILPFTTGSSDPQERELAIGARSALAHTLSRTEFNVAVVDRAAEGLSAPDYIVSADVSSNSGQSVVSVRVTDTLHNAIVYSNRLTASREHASDLPEQVGAQVAGSLGWSASALMLERNHPEDSAVTANMFGNGGSYEESFNAAAKFPDSPMAQINLAFDAAGALPFILHEQRADVAAVGRHAAERARVIAPGFGGNEVVWCLYHSRGRMLECENHLRAGMRYDPDFPWLAHFLADHLKDVGRMEEALGIATKSWGRDPYETNKIGLLLRMLEATGNSREAQRTYETTIRGWPNSGVIFWDRMYGILDRGDFDALAEFGKHAPADVASDVDPAQPVFAAVKARDLGKARRTCLVDQGPSFKRDVCMLALARLGDVKEAMDIAFVTYPNRIGRTPEEEERLWLDGPRYGDTDILMGSGAAPLRTDPRYPELARRIGALAYWRSGRLPDFCSGAHAEPVCPHLRRS
jgi:DNA-binding winged helix-turn-helix (wHTH) protein/TolB-like protein